MAALLGRAARNVTAAATGSVLSLAIEVSPVRASGRCRYRAMCSRPNVSSACRVLWALQRRREFSTVDGPPRAAGWTLVELQPPAAPAAVAVGRDVGAPAAVALEDGAPHLGGNGLPLPGARGAGGSGLPLALRLHRAAALSVLLDGAAHGLAEHRREVSVRDLVGEQALQGLELFLEGGVDGEAHRPLVGGNRVQGRPARRPLQGSKRQGLRLDRRNLSGRGWGQARRWTGQLADPLLRRRPAAPSRRASSERQNCHREP